MKQIFKIAVGIALPFVLGCVDIAWAQSDLLPGLSLLKGAGQLLRADPLPGAPGGATAYRVEYQSTGLNDETVPVTGMVIVPPGTPPLGGFPIVAWAHPTTGVVSRCAPSLARKRFQMIPGLRSLLARGYVVAATDYPGLGTPETHPYLVGASEARAVLDSVRAAHQIAGVGLDPRFAVWGHSQGGQAALFTGLLARTYAPELTLVGVAAAAPATELAALLKIDLDSTGGRNLTAMTLWSWQRVFHAPTSAVLEPSAVPVVDRLAGECIESIYDILVRGQTTRPLAKEFLRDPDFADHEPWSSLLAANTPGPLAPDIPVFVAQGAKDKLVWPRVTQSYVQRLCHQGSRVTLDIVPDASHGFIAFKSADATVAWIADRFAGHAASSNCRS